MSAEASELDCPYVGLAPFEAAHADYFFGRTLDSSVLADNVLARSITVLYGASGVGKSSVLNVGLPKALRTLGIPAQIVSRREWHEPNTVTLWLEGAANRNEGTPERPLIIVLDQFEEFFLYFDTRQIKDFGKALAAIIARRDIEAHLLFSLRDDGLHRLDMLRLHLPGLLETTLELRHLDKAAVREAIEKPVEVWNQHHQPSVAIDHDFADTLILQLLPKDKNGQLIEGGRLELSYLQLALERIWEAEGGAKAKALRTDTLTTTLKGISEISRRHVADVLSKLPDDDLALCATVFDRLVTHSGGKILYPAADLAAVAETPPERMNSILTALASGKNRLLRAVVLPGGERSRGYEILHDILARPILDWTERYEAQAEAVEREKEAQDQQRQAQHRQYARLAIRAAVVIFLFAVLAAVMAYLGLQERQEALHQLEVANKANGRGIWVNLDFTTTTEMTPSEVNALWQLATANQTMRTAFVDAMLSDPALLVRFGRRPEAVMRALGLTWPSPREAQSMLDALLKTIVAPTTEPAQLPPLMHAAQVLPVKFTPQQLQVALDAVVKAISAIIKSATSSASGDTRALTDGVNKAQPRAKAESSQQRLSAFARNVATTRQSMANAASILELAQAVQALSAQLTPVQAQIALEHLLKALAATTDSTMQASSRAAGDLAQKVSSEQVHVILSALLKGLAAGSPLVAIAEMAQAVPGELTDAQAKEFLTLILKAQDLESFGSLFARGGFASFASQQEEKRALQAAIGKFTSKQAQTGLEQFLESLPRNRLSARFDLLEIAMQALAEKLTTEQAQAEFSVAFASFKRARTSALAVQALAGRASPKQAQDALRFVLNAFARTEDPDELLMLARVVQALPVSLNEWQGQALLDPLLRPFMTATTDEFEMIAPAEAIGALAAKLTAAQVLAAFDALLRTIERSSDSVVLDDLGLALKALAVQIPPERTLAVFESLLKTIETVTDPSVAATLAQPVSALAGKLALAAKLSRTQAHDARDPLLHTIAKIAASNDIATLLPLMQGLVALSAELTTAQSEASLALAMTRLANAGVEQEALGWADAIAALARPLPTDAYLATLLEVLKYPTTAGLPTNAILTALRERFADMPGPNSGLQQAVAWLTSRLGAEAVARPPKRPQDAPKVNGSRTAPIYR